MPTQCRHNIVHLRQSRYDSPRPPARTRAPRPPSLQTLSPPRAPVARRRPSMRRRDRRRQSGPCCATQELNGRSSPPAAYPHHLDTVAAVTVSALSWFKLDRACKITRDLVANNPLTPNYSSDYMAVQAWPFVIALYSGVEQALKMLLLSPAQPPVHARRPNEVAIQTRLGEALRGAARQMTVNTSSCTSGSTGACTSTTPTDGSSAPRKTSSLTSTVVAGRAGRSRGGTS